MRNTWRTSRRVLFAFVIMTLAAGSAGCGSLTAPDVSVAEQIGADEQIEDDTWADGALGQQLEQIRSTDKYGAPE